MTQEELDSIAAEAAKVETKMNSLIAPIEAKLAKLEGELTDEKKKELTKQIESDMKAVNDKFLALQKQYDDLDIKMQKQSKVQYEHPIAEQIMSVAGKADWIKNWKDAKRGGTIDFTGIDIMGTKTGTVTRVTDTIPPQFTPLYYPPVRRHIRDFLPTGTTTAPAIWMPYESSVNDGIARVAEGGAKPQSDFTIGVTKWAIEKIATYIVFSEEVLEDLPQFTSYITNRWIEKLKRVEDTKLLYGTGLSDIKGLCVASTAWSDDLASAAVDRLMVLDSACSQVRAHDYYPQYIFLHPTDAMKLRQTRATTYELITEQFGSGNLPINGVPIIEHAAMTSGDFLVADTYGCMLWDRIAANIRFYDQDGNNAIYNLVTAVIEERAALVTYDANAFCFGSFASALARGSA